MSLRTYRRKQYPVYTSTEREGLRKAGRFNAQLMDFVREFVRPGVRTIELDRLVHDYTRDHGHIPACLGYKGYPNTICTSINNVVCHGIPSNTILRDGDIVNLDLTTIVDGWYGDQSETFMIGETSTAARRLVQTTFDALFVGIRAIKPFCSIYEISRAITDFAHPLGYSVVRDYQGHGIGRKFHQEPGIPHYPHQHTKNQILPPGVCFTVEPMLNGGTHQTTLDPRDGWTVRTADGMLSAQFEHTILLTEDGPEILTLTQDGPQEGCRF